MMARVVHSLQKLTSHFASSYRIEWIVVVAPLRTIMMPKYEIYSRRLWIRTRYKTRVAQVFTQA